MEAFRVLRRAGDPNPIRLTWILELRFIADNSGRLGSLQGDVGWRARKVWACRALPRKFRVYLAFRLEGLGGMVGDVGGFCGLDQKRPWW